MPVLRLRKHEVISLYIVFDNTLTLLSLGFFFVFSSLNLGCVWGRGGGGGQILFPSELQEGGGQNLPLQNFKSIKAMTMRISG